jgi:hypothetical protein
LESKIPKSGGHFAKILKSGKRVPFSVKRATPRNNVFIILFALYSTTPRSALRVFAVGLYCVRNTSPIVNNTMQHHDYGAWWSPYG